MRDYQEYLNKIVAIAKKVLHPEESKDYPESIRDSAARRAIYDYFNGNEELTLKLDNIIRDNTEPDYKDNVIKKRRVLRNIHSLLNDEKTTEEIFEIVKVQPEYDK